MTKTHRRWGRIPSTFDKRDLDLRDFMPMGAALRLVKQANWEYTVEALDQGDTPHCVGFSMANFGINLPVFTPYTNKDGHELYYKCKILEGTPASEEGSTIRTAAKVLKNNNRIDGYAFAPDIATIKWWVLNKGPMIVGTIWTEGMMLPDNDNIITIGGDILGGHAYLINEWRTDNFIGIQNSWGQSWGKNGKAYISLDDFEKLFKYNGEAMAAVELENFNKSKECPLVGFIRNLIGN